MAKDVILLPIVHCMRLSLHFIEVFILIYLPGVEIMSHLHSARSFQVLLLAGVRGYTELRPVFWLEMLHAVYFDGIFTEQLL